MALKLKYSKKEEVPAEHSSLYVEKGGAFVLDVEGAVEREKLEEFRNTNVALLKQLESFKGIDPEKARELMARQADLDAQNLLKSGDVAKIVDAKLAPVVQQLEAERANAAALRKQLEEQALQDSLLKAGAKRGVRASAVPDLLARARGKWKVVGGVVMPAADGENQTLDAWVDGLAAEAPHLFENSAGGGATGGGSGGAGFGHGKNPWKKETWNLTEQSRLSRSNPALAAQLKAAAG